MITHAQRATGGLHARTSATQNAIVAFLGEDHGIHLGGRCYPEARWDIGFAFEDLTGSTEVSNIGHARTNKHFIDLVTLNLREVLHIIWIIGAGQDWFFDLV